MDFKYKPQCVFNSLRSSGMHSIRVAFPGLGGRLRRVSGEAEGTRRAPFSPAQLSLSPSHAFRDYAT